MRRRALREEKRRDPPAAKALRKALEWERTMRRRGWTRADIAREEDLTRARVTQVMYLLQLPAGLKQQLLDGDPEVAGMTIQQAIAIARVE